MSNVVSINNKLSNPDKQKDLGLVIDLLLNRLAPNTSRTYVKTIRDFFMFLFNKHYRDCTFDDVRTITYADTLNFVNHLESIYNTGTVRTKLGSLQFLARELNKIEMGCINPSYVHINTKDRGDTKEFGALTEGEIYLLFEYTRELNTKTAIEQYFFFKLCFATAHRSGNLLKCKWSDIYFELEGNESIPVLAIHDKTKTFKTALPQNLYDEMRNNLYRGDKDGRIFNVSKMTLLRTLHKFCDDNGIDRKERNIVIHSIKKASGDVAYAKSNGDILSVAKHLKHSNIETCYRTYLHKNVQFSGQISRNILNDEDIDYSIDKYIKENDKEYIINKLLALDIPTKRLIMRALSPNSDFTNNDTIN